MSISRVKSWIAGEILYAADLNAEFNNILNNALSLISPLTGNLDFNNTFATNFRLEVKTATQSASQQGRVYYQSAEGGSAVHVDSGSAILRVPTIASVRENRLIGLVNPTGVSGATTYGMLQLGTGLTITDNSTTLSTTAAASLGSASILQVQVFS